MTTTEKPLTRETRSLIRNRPLVITLHSRWMEIRTKRGRISYSLDYGAAWSLAVKIHVERIRAEKREARRHRKVPND